MKKVVLTYGLIAGSFVSICMLIGMSYMSHCKGNAGEGTSMLVGYASMLLAFTMVFMGIRNYREKYNGGVITFGQAFKTGILIALIASTMYVVSWLIYYKLFMPNFMQQYAEHSIAHLKATGASQAKIDEETTQMAKYVEWYKNPLFVILMTYMEILPVGLLATLVSALILKRKVKK